MRLLYLLLFIILAKLSFSQFKQTQLLSSTYSNQQNYPHFLSLQNNSFVLSKYENNTNCKRYFKSRNNGIILWSTGIFLLSGGVTMILVGLNNIQYFSFFMPTAGFFSTIISPSFLVIGGIMHARSQKKLNKICKKNSLNLSLNSNSIGFCYNF